MNVFDRFRWWLVKKLNPVLWWMTPEPHRSRLRSIFHVQWDAELARAELQRRALTDQEIISHLHETLVRGAKPDAKND